MSKEVVQIRGEATVEVTQIWPPPFNLIVNSFYITVQPASAVVAVTCGTLTYDSIGDVNSGGCIVTFENTVVAVPPSKPVSGTVVFHIIYWYIPPYVLDCNIAPVFRFDSLSGNFIASKPCYASLAVDSYIVSSKRYKYTPQSEGGITVYGMAYAILYPPQELATQTPPVLKREAIPAPKKAEPSDTNLYEAYKITMPTVINPEGEWHMPINFNSPNYNQANAYGPGVAGPSKDNGWVIKDVPIEIGHVKDGETIYTKSPPPEMKGVPAPVVPLTTTIYNKPSEYTGDDQSWIDGKGVGVDRASKYRDYYTAGVTLKGGSY